MTMELVDSVYVETSCEVIDFQNIPSTGRHLYVVLDMVIASPLYCYINSNTQANQGDYDGTGMRTSSNNMYTFYYGGGYYSNFRNIDVIPDNVGSGKAYYHMWFPRYSDTTASSSSNTGGGGGKTCQVRGWNAYSAYSSGTFAGWKYYTSSAINRLYFKSGSSTGIREGSTISIQVLN